jgi:uncharacterized protein (DUF2252 family)
MNRVAQVGVLWSVALAALAPPVVHAQSSAPTTTAVDAMSLPYEQLERMYGPFVSPTHPTGWAMKVRSVTSDEFKFWRGTKDLFYQWAKVHCSDWMNQPAAFVPIHGDLHPGNIGTYFAGNHSTLAFGMIDFDDASELPFQLELLGGMVTYELIAQVQGIELSQADRETLCQTMCSTYFATLKDVRSIGEIAQGEPVVSKLLGRLAKENYADELEMYTKDGKFRAYTGKPSKIRDVLTPIDERKQEIARALAQAMVDAPGFGAVVKYTSAKEFEAAIKSIALRTRIDSSGSQGLEKIFVLIEKPVVGMDHDVIFYLKQQLPSAAMRAELIPADTSRSPGKRTFELMNRMNQPVPLFSSFADLDAKSYWVSIKEPFSDSLEYDDVKDKATLLAQAKLWAIVAARSHSGNGSLDRLSELETPALQTQLLDRSKAYVKHSHELFQALVNDPHTKQNVEQVDAFLKSLAN